jgi:hypothetical protein
MAIAMAAGARCLRIAGPARIGIEALLQNE